MQDPLLQLARAVQMGVLLAIFALLHRRNRSPRVSWWATGWALVFLHVSAPLFPLPSHMSSFQQVLRLSCLQLAGVVFQISVLGLRSRKQEWQLAAGLALPVTVYSVLMALQVKAPWLYGLCLALSFYAGAVFRYLLHRSHRCSRFYAVVTVAFGTWAIYRQTQGDITTGYLGLLLVAFGVAGVLFYRRYPRATPAVLVTVGGFFCWSAVWALQLLASHLDIFLTQYISLLSLPRVFVAFGMVLVLLEEESLAAQAATERERIANLRTQRFADVTSQLLSGLDVRSKGSEIAQAITEATHFARTAILLVNEDQRLLLVGNSGMPEAVTEQLRGTVAKLTAAEAERICRHGSKVGKRAVWLTAEQSRPLGCSCELNGQNHLVVPMHTVQGSFVGLVCLSETGDPRGVDQTEVAQIEMLTADMAVALDNASMQRELVRTEKLAGLGQLVNGMAHEINNPLTAVLGYSELLNDRAQDDETRRGLATIHREARRMKAIVANLVRFAQQQPGVPTPVEIFPVLLDALRQNAAEVHSRGIELVQQFAPELPCVAVEHGHLRQVLLQVFNNACEAVEQSPKKRITVTALSEGNKVILRFMDTGPGFSDVDRVFDPFFTTKSPGKGMGLGLSICYGILKQHGGNISACNLQSTGACVTIELPAAPARTFGATTAVS